MGGAAAKIAHAVCEFAVCATQAVSLQIACAGGAVVPGEGDHGPAVVEVDGEDKVVARQVPHHRRHLRLRRLRRQLLAQRTPVGKTSVEILVVGVGSGFVNTSIRVQ